jgi:hypothetical protein
MRLTSSGRCLREKASACDAEARIWCSLASNCSAVDNCPPRAVHAIAALSKAYQRTDDVPDALWAQALNLTHAWATAGGALDGAA